MTRRHFQYELKDSTGRHIRIKDSALVIGKVEYMGDDVEDRADQAVPTCERDESDDGSKD
jgi:hypothetical protein